MYIMTELKKHINDTLYKKYLKRFPYLAHHLPYKTPTISQTKSIIDIIKGTEIEPLLQDSLKLLDGRYGLQSTFAINLENRKYIQECKVYRSIQLSSEVTKYVIFLLSFIDPDSCIVGGCVRDSMLGVEPKDWDFVSSKSYEELADLFSSKGFRVDETGKNFLVLNISKDSEHFEIAMFRKDGTYSDGRRPDYVEVGTIYEDSQRRDFTVNALYYRLSDNKLLDPTGSGIVDLYNNTLRFVGKPEDRLEEDYLRGWRYLRFLARGFQPDNKSYKAVKSNWDLIYSKTNPQRVLDEMAKIIKLKV